MTALDGRPGKVIDLTKLHDDDEIELVKQRHPTVAGLKGESPDLALGDLTVAAPPSSNRRIVARGQTAAIWDPDDDSVTVVCWDGGKESVSFVTSALAPLLL